MPYPDGRNERAAQAAFGLWARDACSSLTWERIGYDEQNRWRSIAFAVRVAAGDLTPPAMPGTRAPAEPSPPAEHRAPAAA
jgi:hypothetical protein